MTNYGPLTSAIYGPQNVAGFFEKAAASIRQAQCYCCKKVVEVNERTRREFVITPRPAAEMDSMYDGCKGWN